MTSTISKMFNYFKKNGINTKKHEGNMELLNITSA